MRPQRPSSDCSKLPKNASFCHTCLVPYLSTVVDRNISFHKWLVIELLSCRTVTPVGANQQIDVKTPRLTSISWHTLPTTGISVCFTLLVIVSSSSRPAIPADPDQLTRFDPLPVLRVETARARDYVWCPVACSVLPGWAWRCRKWPNTVWKHLTRFSVFTTCLTWCTLRWPW